METDNETFQQLWISDLTRSPLCVEWNTATQRGHITAPHTSTARIHEGL
jgi:hypothetical protein